MRLLILFLAFITIKSNAECLLPEEAINADVIIIGEIHGNKDQILYAKCILKALHQRDQNLALALEMISQEHHDHLKDWLNKYENADQMAIKIQWWKSGWPNWSIYRPLLTKAYDLKQPLIATDDIASLPRIEIEKIWNEEFEKAYEAWSHIISDYHQYHIEIKKLDELIILQMSRDIHMAQAIKDYKKKNPNQKILFYTGQDHARNHGAIKSLIKPYKSFTIAQNCPKFNHQFDHNTQICAQ